MGIPDIKRVDVDLDLFFNKTPAHMKKKSILIRENSLSFDSDSSAHI